MDENTSNNYSLTFDQAFEFFVSAKRSEGLREKTLISYDEHFRFFKNWLTSRKQEIDKAEQLTAIIVREYLNYMKQDHFNFKTKRYGLGDQTVNGRLRFLKIFYNFLYKEDLVNSNPIESVKFIKMDERPFEPLTEKEMERLMRIPNIKHFPQFRDYVIMNLLYDTALRIQTAISLRIDDVDIRGRRLVIPADKMKSRKTKVIPLSNHVLKLLMELISENKTHFDNDYLFLNWYGEQIVEDTFRRNLKRYVEKAGITKSFSCHDFRRQSITEMLKAGASIFAVMAIADHQSVATTKKYVHFDQETIKNQHDLYSPVVKMRAKFKRR
ncbi:tyrosine-type recombinase/integrase [Cytobacillus sp. FSL H8-0458]|uniref:tyrosine-type recombinase/integrase n=1 Tax=Cytobacillus sp. FSL H8-0458 TaxID=2975346 RepID=UPI0030F967DB